MSTLQRLFFHCHAAFRAAIQSGFGLNCFSPFETEISPSVRPVLVSREVNRDSQFNLMVQQH
jgi:hypothetical protein